ncbi:hypothetical protein [Streptomyces sp. NPDC059452]|uniref:hypothetical protein n=1 Tax=Streptomyces sp. NPDC059452 TaxID=3346835 RepID=UPI0036A81E5B
MEWTFKLHAGLAAALGAVLLVLAALTWLPGTLPLPEAGWPVIALGALVALIVLPALARIALTRADRSTAWQAFRCLPGRAQAGLAALGLACAVLVICTIGGDQGMSSPEAKDGRYYAFQAAGYQRGTVEVSRSQYEAVLEDSQRLMLTVPGFLLTVAAYTVLAAGELRRADRTSAP